MNKVQEYLWFCLHHAIAHLLLLTRSRWAWHFHDWTATHLPDDEQAPDTRDVIYCLSGDSEEVATSVEDLVLNLRDFNSVASGEDVTVEEWRKVRVFDVKVPARGDE